MGVLLVDSLRWGEFPGSTLITVSSMLVLITFIGILSSIVAIVAITATVVAIVGQTLHVAGIVHVVPVRVLVLLLHSFIVLERSVIFVASFARSVLLRLPAIALTIGVKIEFLLRRRLTLSNVQHVVVSISAGSDLQR